MHPYLFLSDLHLHESRPHISEIFFRFLKSDIAADAVGIYILGDLFEFWAGDDAGQYQDVIAALQDCHKRGIPIHFMCGNRDFLVGNSFQNRTGCQIIREPTVIKIDDQNLLLMHGDLLCTDDSQYQAFRNEVRSSEWRVRTLAMPLQERMDYFRSLREDSKQSIKEKPAEIMDVNQQEVERVMQESDCHLLIHGHTHRQDIHHFELKDGPATRIVLGDWYENGNVLALNSYRDYEFIQLDR